MKLVKTLTAAALLASSLAGVASADTLIVSRVVVADELVGYTPLPEPLPRPIPIIVPQPRPLPFPWPGPLCLSCPPLDLDDMRIVNPRVLVLR